ncbi:hypothetical protein V1634_26790 [Plantactinospora veratri]|uniref:SH3 domain-containing protein n=1 Tax=Plantactinospora veratri TaxID=1436122 RepID=A0ABU7SKP5_9ACTN
MTRKVRMAAALMLSVLALSFVAAPASAAESKPNVLTAAPSGAGDAGTLGVCSYFWSNVDGDVGYVESGRSYAAMRSGPYDTCTIDNYAYSGETLYYHCYFLNIYGNRWTHLRVAGTTIDGWVYSGNLNDGGSNNPC